MEPASPTLLSERSYQREDTSVSCFYTFGTSECLDTVLAPNSQGCDELG